MSIVFLVSGIDGVGKSSYIGALKSVQRDCIIESNLCGQHIKGFLRSIHGYGYSIRLRYIGLNTMEESMKRIQNRVEKGGHNIGQADVNRRFNKRFGDLRKILPYCDEAVLFDNENGFSEVAEYKNGQVIPKGEYRPEWLRELMESSGF